MPTPFGELTRMYKMLPKMTAYASASATDVALVAPVSGKYLLLHSFTAANTGTTQEINLRDGSNGTHPSQGRFGVPSGQTTVLEFPRPLLFNTNGGIFVDLATVTGAVCHYTAVYSLIKEDSTEHEMILKAYGQWGPPTKLLSTSIGASAVKLAALTDGRQYWLDSIYAYYTAGTAGAQLMRDGGSGGDVFAAFGLTADHIVRDMHFDHPHGVDGIYATRTTGTGTGFMNAYGWIR